eukprot:2208439-Prorocentrum_lima.AAC.1
MAFGMRESPAMEVKLFVMEQWWTSYSIQVRREALPHQVRRWRPRALHKGSIDWLAAPRAASGNAHPTGSRRAVTKRPGFDAS